MAKQNTDNQNLICLGKIVGVRGLRGELKLHSSLRDLNIIKDLDCITAVLNDGSKTKLSVASLSPFKNVWLISIKGHTDRNSVEPLVGAQLYTPKENCDSLETDEWWITDLIGLDVFSTEGESLGTVCNVTEAGTCLLEIKQLNSEETFFVPFVRELVPKVDVNERRIEINKIPGLCP